jgi:hypothetical protein
MLKQYLAEAAREYHLRLKTVVPLDDAAMDRIEMAVAKYLPLFISKVKKTIIQRQPLEFPNYSNVEIYMVDFTFGLPAAPHVIRDDIRKTLSAADESVFVRNIYEPGELEIETLNALADIEAEALAKNLKLVPVLDDADYNEADGLEHAEMFGNQYNAAFLSYLSAVQKEEAERNAQVANAPFRWLDLSDREDTNPQDTSDFNASIVDAPRVAPQGIDHPKTNRSPFGHFTLGNGTQIRRLYVDKDGNRVVLARTLTGDTT